MTKRMPQVREFMTPMPHTVGSDQPLKVVQDFMREYRVRHLPVKKGGKLVGIVSDRNLKEVFGTAEGAGLKAEDIMMSDPFRVAANTPLVEVAAAMAEEKFGSALVEDDEGKLVGIFTTVDVCRALRQLLETSFAADR